jgi:hypothetical protein
MPTNRSRLDSAMTAPTPIRTRPTLLAELVELGREAWRISERERAVRAESAPSTRLRRISFLAENLAA